jgi:hypothetical protein
MSATRPRRQVKRDQPRSGCRGHRGRQPRATPRPADTWTSPIACCGRRRADALRASQWKRCLARQASRATNSRAPPHAALSGLRLERSVCVYGSSLASARCRFSSIHESAVAQQSSSTARTATQAAPCLCRQRPVSPCLCRQHPVCAITNDNTAPASLLR